MSILQFEIQNRSHFVISDFTACCEIRNQCFILFLTFEHHIFHFPISRKAATTDSNGLQEKILKLAGTFLTKGYVGKASNTSLAQSAAGLFQEVKGDYCNIEDATQDRETVLQRLEFMHQTFSALSHWTTFFAGLVEADNVSLMPSDFSKNFPLGPKPLDDILGGLMVENNDGRGNQMKKLPRKLILKHPELTVKKKKGQSKIKTTFFSGKKLLAKLTKLEETEIETINNLLTPAKAKAKAKAKTKAKAKAKAKPKADEPSSSESESDGDSDDEDDDLKAKAKVKPVADDDDDDDDEDDEDDEEGEEGDDEDGGDDDDQV